ncbi:MAG: hypothetical protein M1840_005547 [Geoglossum simile]|nr:MAG: hypothetical protein M1840_005547 [Geoglossum simile]
MPASPPGCDGARAVPTEEKRRALFRRYLRRQGRRFSGVTWKEYVSVLRDDKDPAGYTREGIRCRKKRIIADYRWNDETGDLIFRRAGTIAVPEHRVYDIIKLEYEAVGKVNTKFHTRCVSPKYHNITVVDVRKWFDLQSGNLSSYPLPQQTNGHDSSGDGENGNELAVQAPSRPTFTSGGGIPVANRDRLPLSDSRAIHTLQEEFNNRRWSRTLGFSRYVDIISGLRAILDAATPASSYVQCNADEPAIQSTPYDSAELLCLTMQQAGVELDTSENFPRPIFIKHDTTATEDLQTIDDYLKDLNNYLSVNVQDLSRKRNQSSGVMWPTDKVISRFEGRSGQSNDQPPINVIDLARTKPNVVPNCFCSGNMRFLSRITHHGGRQLENLGSLSTKAEKWCLLAQACSGTMTRQDHCGLWTWVRVEQGKNLWFICNLSNGDREVFAEKGAAFVGGRWFYLWLEPGDILIMPPGTIHAVYTPVDTLCTGGNAWSQRHMGDSMRSISFEDAHPNVTNGDAFTQIPELLTEVSRRMDAGTTADFGGEEQVWMFNHYYKRYHLAPRQQVTTAATATRPTTSTQEHPKNRKHRHSAKDRPIQRPGRPLRSVRAGANPSSTERRILRQRK